MTFNPELGGERQIDPRERENGFDMWNGSRDFDHRAKLIEQGIRSDASDILSNPEMGLSLPTAEALFAMNAHQLPLSGDSQREVSPLMARVLKIAKELESNR